MKKEIKVIINDYYVNKNTRNTMIYSKHCPIVRGLENATDEEILSIKQQYIKYENEYKNPLNKVKKLMKRR